MPRQLSINALCSTLQRYANVRRQKGKVSVSQTLEYRE